MGPWRRGVCLQVLRREKELSDHRSPSTESGSRRVPSLYRSIQVGKGVGGRIGRGGKDPKVISVAGG